MRHADPADRTALAGDADGGCDRLIVADAFENRVHAEAAAELAHTGDRLFPALAYDVGRAEGLGQRDPVVVPAEQDDLLGPEPLRRDDTTEADSTVADDGDLRAAVHAGGDGSVVAGAHHVGEREERGHQRVVLVHPDREERAIGERDPSASAWAPLRPALPKKPPWTQAVFSPSWQKAQVPSE